MVLGFERARAVARSWLWFTWLQGTRVRSPCVLLFLLCVDLASFRILRGAWFPLCTLGVLGRIRLRFALLF